MIIDINLICRNNEEKIQQTLESVSEQTFEAFRVLIIDDGSTDATPDIVKKHMKRDTRFKYTRNDCRLYVGNFQRAFWEGDSEFIMPKSSDDLIDKTYIEKCLSRLNEDPELAMVHTGSDVIGENGNINRQYAKNTYLRFLENDPIVRALKLANTYTFSPCYWGVYRRKFVSKLAPILYCGGFDHIVLCELALYGKLDYVDEVLFHRSKGGAPLTENAKMATLNHIRDLSLTSSTADFSYITPLLTMIIGHIEMARLVRLQENQRGFFIKSLINVLVNRFKSRLDIELQILSANTSNFEHFLEKSAVDPLVQKIFAHALFHYLTAIEIVLCEADSGLSRAENVEHNSSFDKTSISSLKKSLIEVL